MQSVTASSSKDEILSTACELTDHQAATIEQLQAQTRLLGLALAVAVAWHLLT